VSYLSFIFSWRPLTSILDFPESNIVPYVKLNILGSDHLEVDAEVGEGTG